MDGYRNSSALFRTVPSRPPMASPSSRLGVYNLATPLISGTSKATDFEFGAYIYRANPNKNPLKILEKREREHIHGLPQFFECPLLFQERVMGKATDFKFCRNILRVDRNKNP